MKKILLPFLLILFLFTACNLPKAHTPTAGMKTRVATQDIDLEEIPTSTMALPRPTLTGIVTLTPAMQAGVTVTGTRTYDAVFEVKLINNGSGSADRIRVVTAMISDREPFQRVLSMNVSHAYTLETDAYDNQFAVIEITDFAAGQEITLRFEYRVEVDALVFNLGDCAGNLAYDEVYAEEYIEADAAEIVEYAETLAGGQSNLCETARAYYDFVGDNLEYDGYNPGEVGALAALNNLAGDCTEFSDLYTALLRAGGIPALPVEGITCCTEAENYTAGGTKHNWLLANLPGVDWTPMDPTWGRFEHQRDAFFAAIDDQHIILTVGRNPAAMNGYHGFTYTWWGNEVVIDNEESWSLLEVVE